MKRLVPALMFVAAAGALSMVTALAQERPQTPAVATEGRLTDPAPDLPRGRYLPPNWLQDDQFLKWPYPAGDTAYTDLDGFRIKSMINEITAISRLYAFRTVIFSSSLSYFYVLRYGEKPRLSQNLYTMKRDEYHALQFHNARIAHPDPAPCRMYSNDTERGGAGAGSRRLCDH